MAQINTIVGDLEYNKQKIITYIQKAKEQQADIVSFPELAICGYPPEDLVLKPGFVRDNLLELGEIAAVQPEIVAVVGFVDQVNDNLYNAAAVLHDGKVQAIYHKKHLPNYGVFDEMRYFATGQGYVIFELNGVNVGINICEDIWYKEPTGTIAQIGGAQLVINVNSSPYSLHKFEERQENLAERSNDNQVYIAYNNMVGGQDELVFDGGAMFTDMNGKMISHGSRFAEDLVVEDLKFSDTKRQSQLEPIVINTQEQPKQPLKKKASAKIGREEEIYSALVLGVRDYVTKNKFKKALISLSGGVDSALSLAIAVDALGADNLLAIYQPSRFSSEDSRQDSILMADNLGIKLHEISIDSLFEDYLQTLKPYFNDLPLSEAEENIQARIRGNIAMAFSNKFGYIVLSTGNKSEFSVGYATLYGDMAGGFAVLKDVYKTEVYRLADYRNSIGPTIPERILTKAPSAELSPNQKDEDSLPPYDLLDAILKLYVEEYKTAQEIIAAGYDKGIVERVVKMVDTNEYKRRQAPPGIKITPRAFGRDRRMPITQGYLGKRKM